MKKLNVLLIIFAMVGIITASSCKKSGSDPSPADLIKRTWKADEVSAKQGADSSRIYKSGDATSTTDFSKYKLKFDGTNYTYTDVSGNSSSGTYTFGTNNKTIIFKDGALDGKIFNIITLTGSTLKITYPDNSSKIPRQLTITTLPG